MSIKKNQIRRINLFGGPGSSKSTTAAWLFAALKIRHISIELITEYVKKYAYEKRQINEFDQIYIFGKQLNYEHRFLNAGVDYIITDSPVLLSGIYSQLYYEDLNIASNIYEITKKYDSKYPPLNIFLDRKDRPYNQSGRYQTKDEAIHIDNTIRSVFHARSIPITCFDYDKRDDMLAFVLNKI